MRTARGSKMVRPIFIGRWTPKILFSLIGKALPTRAVAPSPRKCLSAHAYQDASQSRIHGINRPACDQIEDHRCRVFADPAGKDTHRSVERNVPLVEATRQTG
jgi:hypothetical protein